MKRRKAIKILWMVLCICLSMCISGVTAGAASKTTKTKAAYSFKTYRDSYTNSTGSVTADYKFVLPQLKGNSSVVKKINASLKKEYQKTMKNKSNLFSAAKRSANRTYKEKYFYKTTCKATYNKKGYVSFCFKLDWFAGGVHNMYHYGASYSLRTGKKLALTDVVSGSKTRIKNTIADKYYAKLGGGYASKSELSSAIKKRKWSELYFYLKNGKVYVSCGAYAPLYGNGEVLISLKGKY